MTTVNIPLEVPADCVWDTDELVERVKRYAARLMKAAVPVRQQASEMPVELLADFMANSEQQIKRGQVFSQNEMERMVASW